MKLIGITCRVEIIDKYEERRDALDQRWFRFIEEAGYLPILIPNNINVAKQYLNLFEISGFLLTGGNSLVSCSGDAPERDQIDNFLITTALQKKVPLIGVCRGMQSIQAYFQITLEKVIGHVSRKMELTIKGAQKTKNSYHTWGSYRTESPLICWAVSKDGVIKAIKHESEPLYGVMWHPEREKPYMHDDIEFFRTVFN